MTRHLRVLGIATLAAAASGLLGAGDTLAAAPALHAGTRYARVHHICRAPVPRRASCLVQALVAAPAGTAGARSYQAAAGAAATGPAGGLTPADLASAYSYTPTGGSGQTVAIVDAFDDPKIEADLETFDGNYGLPACTSTNGCFEKVGESGSTTSLPSADLVGWSVEITLDVETVHSVCESCKILLVEANSERFSDLAASVNEAVTLGATEISNSYGGLETSFGATEQAAYNHPGVVIAASAGDSGYLNWDYVAEGREAPELPDAPAALPTVVAVGGTALQLTSTGARKSETVWNDSGRPTVEEFKQFSATGGGCSTRFTAPAWQQAVAGWSATGCGSARLDNDVAAVADPYTGFDIYDSYAYEPKVKTGWLTVGGTSLTSPLVAALYGLAGGSEGASYPAATLYAHLGQSSSLYDVSAGGDGYCDGEAPGPCGEPEVNEVLGNVDCEGTTACDAAVGFDGPSGVGSPNGLGAFTATKSAPTVVTGAASTATAGAATLNATVNPNGQPVSSCVFEWGPNSSYGQSAACSPSPGTGTSPVAVAAALTGLAANATYHFRVLATNPTGTSYGEDAAFTTPNPPEFGRCVKVAKGVRGSYSTAACTVTATPTKYAFEWERGAGSKARFNGAIKPLTAAVIETVGKKQVTCTGASDSGEYASHWTLAGVVITLTGCQMAGSSCSSSGAAAGEVVSPALAGALGVISKSAEGPVKNKLGLDLFAATEAGPVAEFRCGATAVLVSGSVLVPVTSDKMALKATLKYVATLGKQKPEGFEGLPSDVLQAALAEAPPEQAALKLTIVQTSEEAIEINSVV